MGEHQRFKSTRRMQARTLCPRPQQESDGETSNNDIFAQGSSQPQVGTMARHDHPPPNHPCTGGCGKRWDTVHYIIEEDRWVDNGDEVKGFTWRRDSQSTLYRLWYKSKADGRYCIACDNAGRIRPDKPSKSANVGRASKATNYV